MRNAKRTIILGIIAFIAGAGVFAWYAAAVKDEAVPEVDVKFIPGGAWLSFGSPLRLETVEIRSPDGVIVSQRLNNIEKENLWLAFDWRSDTTYRFRFSSNQGTLEIKAESPDNDYAAAVQFSAPFTSIAEQAAPGIFEDKMEESSTAVENNELTSAVVVTVYRQGETVVTGTVSIPGGVRVAVPPRSAGTSVVEGEDETVIRFGTTLSVAYERFYLPFSIQAPKTGSYRLRAEVTLERAGEGVSLFSREVTVRVVEQESAGEAVKVVDTAMPVGVSGIPLRRYAEDTLYIQPAAFRKLGRLFGVEPKYTDYRHPFTYQSLVLDNTGTGTIALLVSSGIYFMDRDVMPEAFRPPDILTGGTAEAAVTVTAVLQPGEESTVVLPVYLSSAPRPGEYRRVLRLIPMGSAAPVAEYEFPVYVRSMNPTAWGFTLFAVFLSVTSASVFVLRFKRIVAGMRVRWLVIISLYGAMTFVVSNLPVRIFGNLVSALLGPFSAFVTGFFSELLYWTLLVSLVRSIPRPGTVTFAALVRYMLNGIMFGGFQLTDILFTGTGIVAKEAAFYASGLTRRGEGFNWSTPAVIRLALCLSAADAFITLTGLYLHMVLFRLYFADWYIYMTLGVNSLLYTFAATFMGWRFSERLRWEDG